MAAITAPTSGCHPAFCLNGIEIVIVMEGRFPSQPHLLHYIAHKCHRPKKPNTRKLRIYNVIGPYSDKRAVLSVIIKGGYEPGVAIGLAQAKNRGVEFREVLVFATRGTGDTQQKL